MKRYEIIISYREGFKHIEESFEYKTKKEALNELEIYNDLKESGDINMVEMIDHAKKKL